MQGVHLRKYGVEAVINFELYEVDGVDLRVDAADAGSDCTIMKDQGAEATCDNDFVDEGMGYSLTLTATEMQAAQISVYIIDSATKVWLDKVLTIETYGNASAMHAFDLDTASVAQTADNDTKITTVDTVVDAIKAITDNLPDSGALTTIGTDTARLTAVRAAILTDWINGGRLDLLLDAIPTTSMRGTDNAATEAKQDIIDTVVDANKTAIDHATYGLSAIRTRGDAAWITGGGGSITDMLHIHPLIPSTIDLADTATIRIALGISNMLDDLPSTAEITPGTITIDRKAVGGTSWTNVVNAAACSEAAGLIYYDEVFDSTTGYRPGDSIRITFKGQKITVSANDYEITPTDGWMFYTYIRGAERTDTATAAHTYTVLDGDSNGISDVLVEAKLTGTSILVQSARTNSSGVATFNLAPGTYDFYATKAGYSFSNPDTETVS